ncbi:glycoside hydrolase family 5 protein [Marvinbryantia sp.]|uniref:glycoside hydrolase family 5 protein n=1 Tax=Marvinbryantia sp. TaxID=2496532 RepID=UPI0025D786C9|nr:cellulase family glycosylhydrolase [uncultured Marvinbryantia sp.]
MIKGVNLGNWLVLEKWMSPALFAGTTAEDEYYLPTQLSPEVYEARIKIHRSEYITERDFAAIRRIGLNAVRIPVPYFIFGDRPPFIGCIEELDKAFSWAEKYGLGVLIDLHTVPMSQNGFDNGGLSGVCRWSQLPEEVEFVLNVLEKLARRYGHRKGLLGITPVNEPITEPMWSEMNVQKRYPAVDTALAAGSAPNTMEFLRGFYRDAYSRIHPHLAEDKYVIFHDAFRLKDWKEFFAEEKFENVMLDTHQYLMLAEMEGCEQTPDGYLAYIREVCAKDIAEVQEYVDVICGEWCLFNSFATGVDTRGGQSVLNGMDYAKNEETLDAGEKRLLYRQLADAQLTAWQQGAGYFYWSYKLLLDTVNEPEWIGWDSWDLGKCADEGWFPAVG